MYKFTGVGMDEYTDTSTYAETGRFRMQMHVYGICGVSGLVSTSMQSIRISFVLSKCPFWVLCGISIRRIYMAAYVSCADQF